MAVEPSSGPIQAQSGKLVVLGVDRRGEPLRVVRHLLLLLPRRLLGLFLTIGWRRGAGGIVIRDQRERGEPILG